MSTMTTDARVWIGCLHCYNSGRLIGEWYAAAAADTVSIEALHVDAGTIARVSCEEMWVMDFEGLPISGECSPMEAAKWGRLLEDVDDEKRDALLAWVRSGYYVAEGNTDLPSLPEFDERYVGEWESFSDYAQHLADDTSLLRHVPEEIARYFDWSAWTRDLAYDYETETAPSGGVFVFRSH